MRMLRRLLVVGIFAALFYAAWRFVSGNQSETSVDLVFIQLPQVPLWTLLLGAFALGALSAGVSLVYELAKKSFATRRYRKQMAGLESEIHQLRNLPLAAPEPRPGPSLARPAPADDVVRQRS
jgi:uncharacterized integral membrane protein